MKKIVMIALLGILSLSVSSCFKRDDLEDVTVYTTVYPVEFLTDNLYGYNSDVRSIYPDGVAVYEYELTEKQVNDYSKASIFVYNGLTDEKQIAKKFINKNGKMRIIDVSYGLKYTYSVEELWLSPNNYLMLATTIKNNLQDFIDNKYIKDEIENNYVTNLENPLSLMDAELRSIAASNQKGNNNPIIATSSVFKFLIHYGFEVICLEDKENLTTSALSNIKSKFSNGTYTYLFVRDDEELSEIAQDLISNYKAEKKVIYTMNNLSDEQRKNSETYFTLMTKNVEYIKNATIGK